MFVHRDLGVLTPVDPLSVVGSMVIAVDQVMEVDKAEEIPVKQVAVSMSLFGDCFNRELISYSIETKLQENSQEVNQCQA